MVARRSVGPLAIGQTSGGTVVVAPTAPPGSYFLLACADVSAQVTESDEKNNCKASVGTGAMGPPDLVVSSIGDPPAALVTGGSFLVSDTTANTGHLTAPESITRFFLSTDELPGDDREVETGSRVVRPLAAGEASTRLTDITLDPATPPGSYFLLACADAGGAVGEPSEANNCRASAGRVTVTSTSCGDGVLAGTETCDDGNTDDDDGCDRDCVPTAVTQLAAGSFHNCALLRSGAVRCWGYAGFGQLGYPGDEIPRQNIGDDETPASAGNVEVGGWVAELTAGWAHTCARLVTGAVRCWGWADDGQLGYGNSVDIGDNETPASAGDVELGGSAVKLTAGRFHNCALLDGGAVRCWGSGAFGALGYGSMANIGDNETPASAGDVDVGGAVVDLDAGMFHTCAVLADGHARCWGHGGNGRLGHGNSEYIGDDETPASAGDVDVGGAVVELATGGDHTCARLDTGAVRCWGYAWYGVLGYGTQDDVGDDETPASAGDVDVGGAAAEIDAGYDHVCARLEGGSVRCWGHGFAGTLGHASTETIGDDETPASAGDVSLGGQAVQLVTGWNHTCARLDGGAVRCWGYGGEGELGYGNRDDIGDDETPASAGPVEIF
jgi:cysteine-rich repeat protein